MRRGVSEIIYNSIRGLSKSAPKKISQNSKTPCKPCSESTKKPETASNVGSNSAALNLKPSSSSVAMKTILPRSPSPAFPVRSSSFSTPKISESSKSSSSSSFHSSSKKTHGSNPCESKPCESNPCESKSSSNCSHHNGLLPPGDCLKNVKSYELKSDCASFELKTHGF